MNLKNETIEPVAIPELADLLALAHVRLRKRRIIAESCEYFLDSLANVTGRAITDKRTLVLLERSLEND